MITRNVIAETEDYIVKTTGHDYDFASTIENKTDRTLHFVMDEDESYETDAEGKHIVWRETDDEDEIEDLDGFEIAPLDWIGLPAGEYVNVDEDAVGYAFA